VEQALQAWLFHWTPDRALWSGGETLSWDARCAGIYAGFAVGVIYQLAAVWRKSGLPTPGALLLFGVLALPLFADVASLALGYRAPSNDVRYLSGLLFGGGLSVALAPSVLNLAGLGGERRRGALYWSPVLAGLVAAYLLKSVQNKAAFLATQGLCYAGFLSLAGLLVAGACAILRRE